MTTLIYFVHTIYKLYVGFVKLWTMFLYIYKIFMLTVLNGLYIKFATLILIQCGHYLYPLSGEIILHVKYVTTYLGTISIEKSLYKQLGILLQAKTFRQHCFVLLMSIVQEVSIFVRYLFEHIVVNICVNFIDISYYKQTKVNF